MRIGETFNSLAAPKSNTQIWSVGLVFLGVGILIGIMMPFLFIRNPDAKTKIADGSVIDYVVDEEDSELMTELYEFSLPSGETYQFNTDMWSSEPSYAIGDHVEIYYDSEDPKDAWVKDDKNLATVLIVLYILGGIFGLIGATITIMKMRNLDNATINNVGGLMGALAFGIPATLAFPIITLINAGKPIQAGEAVASEGDFFIGIIFTVLGIITTVGAILLFRYQQKTGSNGIFINFKQ